MNERLFHPCAPRIPHVAIIMDGSGRWALERGLPRTAGHRTGVEAVRRVVRAAAGLGVDTLTLHAFSSDNWQRSAEEVANLLRIFEDYLRAELAGWVAQETRVNVIGRRDRLPEWLVNSIETAERATAEGTGLHLILAIDYSARDAILRAATRFNWAMAPVTPSRELALLSEAQPETVILSEAPYPTLRGPDRSGRGEAKNLPSRAAFVRLLAETMHRDATVPDVDLLIRTGGEQRLSDFLLWECAYAELVFTPRLWPDFDARDLEAAIQEFHSRRRRFGRVPEPVAV